jgi:ABC-type enterochelin transport system permease subunit
MIKTSAIGGLPIFKRGKPMDAMARVKMWIGGLTDIGLMLLGLAIVAALLVGGSLPFFGGVVGNIVGMVNDLGKNGLAGLIAVGIILWLFSKRSTI